MEDITNTAETLELPGAEETKPKRRGRPPGVKNGEGKTSTTKKPSNKNKYLEEAKGLVMFYVSYMSRAHGDKPFSKEEVDAHVIAVANVLEKYDRGIPVEAQLVFVFGMSYFGRAGLPKFITDYIEKRKNADS